MKRHQREAATRLVLEDAGIPYEERAGRFVISEGGQVFDFWPQTCKWAVRGTESVHKGLFNLLDELNHEFRRP